MRRLLCRLGLYRPLRRLYRTVLDRQGIREFQSHAKLLSQFIGPNDLCFDLGAYRGFKTELMLSFGARVVAVEPIPASYERMTEIVGRNTRATLLQAAVGAFDGVAALHIARSRQLSSLRSDWQAEWTGEIEVETVKLDTLIARFGQPRFCKIDVEGFELEVLKGLSQPLPIVCMEFHTAAEPWSDTLACIERLGALAEIRVNYSRKEEPLLRGRWLGREEFVSTWEQERSAARFSYGNVFIVCPQLVDSGRLEGFV